MRFYTKRGEKIHLPKHYLATMCIQNKFHLEHLKIEKKGTKQTNHTQNIKLTCMMSVSV